MTPDPEEAFGIVRITTGGIQNLAALIPLLTTELCEKHVSKALKKGLLYAAVAPMTIFGSLGIAKAGFIALCATIDYPFFHGPALLKNAGFPPRGVGKLLLHVKHNKHHLYKAEDKLRTILNKKKITQVEVNLWSWDFWWWNIRLALFTTLMCGVGLIPYIFIRIFMPHHSFQTTWIFPLLRLFGSGLVVVNTQFLFQLRLIEETYCRLRFIAADTYLKDEGKSIPTNWDPNERSKKVFADLHSEWLPLTEELEDKTTSAISRYQLNNDDKKKILDGVHKLTTFKFSASDPSSLGTPHNPNNGTRTPFSATPNPSAQMTLHPSHSGLTPPAATPELGDTLRPPRSSGLTPSLKTPNSSPQDTLHRRQSSETRKDTVAFDKAEQGTAEDEIPPLPARVNTDSSTGSSLPLAKANKIILWLTPQFPTLVLWCTQVVLLFGVICIIFGYIGCFTVVQLGLGWKGPLLWFLLEVFLSGVRTVIWAANPDWDDAKLPIVLEKVRKKDGTRAPANSSSYGIGWTLDSPTADDMHALIIGVNNSNTTDFEDLEKAKSDAESVAKYLAETLLVPPSQIRTLYDTDATRSRIVEELKSLRHRGSVTPDAPIVIYFAGHSFVSEDGSTYLVPHLPNGDRQLAGEPEKYCLPYSEIVDLLRHVADEKTDNILVILDSCHAGAMGRNAHFDSQPNSPKGLGLTPTNPSKSKPSGLPTTAEWDLQPSLSRHSSGEGGVESTLADLRLSSIDLKLRQVGVDELHERGKKKRKKKITNATTEILVGHSSHLLLAGADSRQQAYEDPLLGGQFTRTLLKVLRDAGESADDLQKMTYKTLVERIQGEFAQIIVDSKSKTNRTLLDYQTALCTTIYQNRHLFDGLFTRKVDKSSASPVMRVRYSD